MIKQNRIIVSSNQDKTIYGISIPLDIENEKDIVNNIEKINFTYIKYAGIRKFIENDSQVEKYFIEFVNMPIKLIEELANLINNEIDDSNNKNIYEIIDWITQLFSKHDFKTKIKKEFNLNFAEALFMLNCIKKLNFNISKYYQKNEDNDQHTFHISKLNKDIEIKSCHKGNSKVVFDNTLIEKNRKDFYTVEFKFIEGKTNILQIYEEIGFDNPIVKDRYDLWKEWLNDIEGASIILKEKTVDTGNIDCFKISPDSIPKISISNTQCVEKMEITLNVADSKKNGINELLNLINLIKTT